MGLEPDAIVQRFADGLGDAVVSTHTQHGNATVSVSPDRWVDAVRFARDDEQLDMNYWRDYTCVDYIEEHPRFELVLHLYSLNQRHAVRLKCRVPEDDAAIDTLIDVFPVCNWYEREIWDMYGVHINGHPDLRRLLMYDGFEGHALRKDFPVLKAFPLVAPLPAPADRPDLSQQIVQIEPLRKRETNGA